MHLSLVVLSVLFVTRAFAEPENEFEDDDDDEEEEDQSEFAEVSRNLQISLILKVEAKIELRF